MLSTELYNFAVGYSFHALSNLNHISAIVVNFTVFPNLSNISKNIIESRINSIFQISSQSTQVHRLLDNIRIVLKL